MLRLTRKIEGPAQVIGTLTLPLEQRTRSRLRVRLDDGREAGLFLGRGTLLRDGDLLADDNGLAVQVRAAAEPVSTARASDPGSLLLARACYHLGNRHVPLQISEQWVRYQPDHVLDALCRRLGLEVSREQAPFDPEPGAYGSHADGHGHAHGHGHDHSHEH